MESLHCILLASLKWQKKFSNDKAESVLAKCCTTMNENKIGLYKDKTTINDLLLNYQKDAVKNSKAAKA